MGASIRRLAAEERGMALASTMALLLIVLVVGAIGSGVAISSLQETNRDRNSTDAFAVADSAIDVTNWRMNRMLVSPEVQGLLGLSGGLTQLLGCVGVSAGDVQVTLSTGALCQSDLDDIGGGVTASCSTEAFVGVDLDDVTTTLTNGAVSGERILQRDVVCWATDDGVTRRVRARLGLRLTLAADHVSLGDVTSLWKRYGWVECTAVVPSATNPFAGCPDVPDVT